MSSISNKNFRKGCVVVGMSGGVDSSVAAWLLKQKGYRVIGLFMENWKDESGFCSVKQDLLDAVSIADFIGIDFDHVNFSLQYKDRVFKNFLHEYLCGRTPNPDVFCNSEIKFNLFMKHAIELGADYIATGHYAKNIRIGNKIQLLKADDIYKDQSYFLYRLNQSQLMKTIFPLGKISKEQVREIARKIGLHNADKKDSTGICFVGKRPFKTFLASYISMNPGPILTQNKRNLGQHDGLPFYTIGQRKGLGIGGTKDNEAESKNFKDKAWYVAEKNFDENSLIVVQGKNHPKLFSNSLYAKEANWILGKIPENAQYMAKIRFRQKGASCHLKIISDKLFELVFFEPQWAVTRGQSVVIYKNDICLGGGVIC